LPTLLEPGLAEIRGIIRAEARNRPGVYRMVAETGVVIYVGKSKQVRTRLLGYLRAKSTDKAWRIIREARRVEWDYVPSEFAALLLELELIKKFRPPYNVHQKRDALYSFLRLSPGGAPALNVVRRVSEQPGTYYGPFRGGQRIVEAVRELNDVLQLRDCGSATPIHYADQADLFGGQMVPLCVRYELNRCLAPCAARCTEAEYARRVEQAWRFLAGDANGPIEELTGRMADAAGRMEFEHAARLRDRISRLEALRAEFARLHEALTGLTFLYCVPGFDGNHLVYAIRGGSVRAIASAPRTARQRRRLIEAMAPHLAAPEERHQTAARERIEQILLVSHWFRMHPDQLSWAYGVDRLNDLPLKRHLDKVSAA
jgi:excinuclease ABC subunit C